jgi:hypothetical protein
MSECILHECYYFNSSDFLDDVLEYFQEDHDKRAKEFIAWREKKHPELKDIEEVSNATC